MKFGAGLSWLRRRPRCRLL